MAASRPALAAEAGVRQEADEMNKLALSVLAVLVQGTIAFGQAEEPYRGIYDRNNVIVAVEYTGQWNRPKVAAMDCAGRIKVVGAYRDTTSVSAQIDPDTAIELISSLLEIDFFGLPDTYRQICGLLRPAGEDSVGVAMRDTIDHSVTRVTLHLGPKSHTVTMRYPAYGTPEELNEFIERFNKLLDEAFK